MNLIPLFQEKFGQVGAILARYSRDECALGQGVPQSCEKFFQVQEPKTGQPWQAWLGAIIAIWASIYRIRVQSWCRVARDRLNSVSLQPFTCDGVLSLALTGWRKAL